MRGYVRITGAIFGLVTLLHIWRIGVERNLATDPWFLLLTAVALSLCVWAWRLLRQFPGG
ncbi:MAG TPA: hypothetical protein VFW45_15840 [Candidatus Polarisedimenticolia bacterium]|nr:hypothetical protein [Candidatus Polarisedimenticolia bacterium]